MKARDNGKPRSQIAQELRAATAVRVFAVVLVGNRVLVKEVPVLIPPPCRACCHGEGRSLANGAAGEDNSVRGGLLR